MKDRVEVTFECLECGGTIISLPDDYTDDSPASCKACGKVFGRWGDVQAKAAEVVGKRLVGPIADGLRISGWKIKDD